MMATTYTPLPDQESGRLRCSVHGCFLVLRRLRIATPKRGDRMLQFYICPRRGCGYMRADKHQAGGRRANIAKARTKQLEGRVDGIIDKIIGVVDKAMKP